MPSFLLALILLLYLSKDPFFVQGSRGDTILQDTVSDDFGSIISNSNGDSDTWLLQPKGDSSPLLGATIDEKENLGPNTDTPAAAASSNFPSYNDDNKLLLSETTTNSETGSGDGLLRGSSSNNDCRTSSSSSTDDSTLESSRQTAATQQNPTKKRNIRGRWRRRGQEEDASNTFCTAPPPLSPSTQQTPKNPSPQRKQKKKKTAPQEREQQQQQGDEETVPPTTPSIADLNWDKEMYPSLFRIPTDGYSEAGYNPTCIIKTNGLLPLGVCDSGDVEDRQNSMYDTNGNPVDTGLFLDAVTHKLNHCRLAPTLANSCLPKESKFWCCKQFEVVLGVGVADICLQLAAVEGKFY